MVDVEGGEHHGRPHPVFQEGRVAVVVEGSEGCRGRAGRAAKARLVVAHSEGRADGQTRHGVGLCPGKREGLNRRGQGLYHRASGREVLMADGGYPGG